MISPNSYIALSSVCLGLYLRCSAADIARAVCLSDDAFEDESKILSSQQSKQLTSFLPPTKRKPVLLYRATRDGWEAKSFHSKCDGAGNIVAIIRTNKGLICGGYTGSAAWLSASGLGVDVKDESRTAFLYSLVNA